MVTDEPLGEVLKCILAHIDRLICCGFKELAVPNERQEHLPPSD
jgi:hypothetical protein